MIHIELLMEQVGEKRIAFWLTDKLMRQESNLAEGHFYLETFNILEIEANLYLFQELGLDIDSEESFFLEIDIFKSKFDINIFIINNDEEDKKMKLEKLRISSGGIRGNGYAKIENCIFLSNSLKEVQISNIDINSIEAICSIEYPLLKINYSTISQLSIQNGYNFDLKNAVVEVLKIENSLENTSFKVVLNSDIINNIYLNKSGINFLEINKTILKNGKLLDCSIAKFILEDSDLGDLNFINISFSELVRIVRSYFEKIRMLNIKWHYYFLDDINIPPGDIKDTYRQLKYVYDNSGNITEANKFFAKEMEYYMKSLKESGNMKDYGIALLQKWVSNFGQDWLRALKIYFIVCLLGFCFAQLGQAFCNYIYGVNYLFDCFYVVKKELVQYVNPLPKIDEVPGFWYLLVSIVKLLLVYQVTVALRRISQR